MKSCPQFNKLSLFVGTVLLFGCSFEPFEILFLPNADCDNRIIYGYTDRQSYSQGDSVTLFLQTGQSVCSCQLRIYDQHSNMVFSAAVAFTSQSENRNSPSENGFGLSPTIQFILPATMTPGVYLVENRIPLIVRSRQNRDILIVYPTNTANAYSMSGGMSLYSKKNRPHQVSFDRPVDLQTQCVSCLQWLEKKSEYSMSYAADADLESEAILKNVKLLVLIGHSEYWTRRARKNFDSYINDGGNALILSGNTMWWQVRYSSDKRKLICYKDEHGHSSDPYKDPSLQTTVWTDERLRYPILQSIGADFAHGGYGQEVDQGWDGYRIVAKNSPLLVGTGLSIGDTLQLPTTEYDGAPITGFDLDGYPKLDKQSLGFFKSELIGYDFGKRGNKETIGTFVIFKKSPSSGIVINTSSTDWCSPRGIGGSNGASIQRITENAIQLLLDNKNIFSN